MGSCEFLIGFLAFGLPVAFLGMARAALHAGNLPRAEGLATTAGVWSWILLGAAAVFAIPALFAGFPFWRHPEFAAALSAAVPIWLWSRTLYASIRARREAEAGSAPPADEPG